LRSHLYLVTAVCADREPCFADVQHARAAKATLDSDRCWPSAVAISWVLMPDHWHGLIRVSGDESLSRIVQRAKSLITKALRSQFGAIGKVWQKGFHDHALRHEEAVNETLRYMLANPVRAGLVGHWSEWEFRGGSHIAELSEEDTLA